MLPVGPLPLGIQQFIDGGFITNGGASLQLIPVGAKPRAPHQMGHQVDAFLVYFALNGHRINSETRMLPENRRFHSANSIHLNRIFGRLT